MAVFNIELRSKGATNFSDGDLFYLKTSYNALVDVPSSFTPSSHSHGTISNSGQTNGVPVTVASGDYLAMIDATDGWRLVQSSIAFGSADGTYLSKAGTWSTPTATVGLATTSVIGGMEIGFTSTETNRAILLSANKGYVSLPRQIPAVTLNNASSTSPSFYAPTAGGTANYGLFGNGTSSAPIWDRPHTTLVTGTSMTNDTYISAFTFTNYRFIHVQLFLTGSTTTKRSEFMIDTTDTKQLASANGGLTYFRMIWNDGSSTWADTITIQRVTSTTMNFKVLSGQAFTCRVIGYRGA